MQMMISGPCLNKHIWRGNPAQEARKQIDILHQMRSHSKQPSSYVKGI